MMHEYFTAAFVLIAALIGGVFFAFSVFVMRALADLPAAEGVRAMQRINVVVINPWFLGPFFGAMVVGAAAAAAALCFSRRSSTRSGPSV